MPSSSTNYQTVPFKHQDQSSSTPIISSNERAKSVEYSQRTNKSKRQQHSNSTVHINQSHMTELEGEKRELNILNNRFGNYLDKIKHLANINAQLHRQVDDAYRKYIGHTNDKTPHSSQIKLNNLREQINDEVRTQTLIQIRLQRAEYDIKFYQNNIKLFSTFEQQQSQQIQTMRQQFEFSLHELEQLKEQHQKCEHDLQLYRNQYNELMNKLIELTNNYDRITYERIENENNLHTLKEQVTFEQEYHQRRLDELKYFEQFHYDFHRNYHQNEFQDIVRRIREDYREFNEIHLTELETIYKNKLDHIRQELIKREDKHNSIKPQDVRQAIDSTKKEHRTLIEQNHLLKDKFEQLEHDLNNIIEQNRQRYEIAEREYQQLHMEIPELDCIIVHLRENTVNLWSEINTYRYLLLNLLSSTNEKTPSKDEQITKVKSSSIEQYRDETTGFIVNIQDGIIWVRI